MKSTRIIAALVAASLVGSVFAQGHDRYRSEPGRYGQGRFDRGAGPEHQFYRGDRMAPEFRSNQFVVDDWRAHRLSAPPRGYHWVQSGGDYVLVGIATGLILSAVLLDSR